MPPTFSAPPRALPSQKPQSSRRTGQLCGLTVLTIALGLGGALGHTGAAAQESPARILRIAPAPLASALVQFGQQAGITLVADAELTRTLQSPGVQGSMSVEAALRQLLAGTGLAAVRTQAGEYTLTPASQPAVTELSSVEVQGTLDDDATTENSGLYAAANSTLGKRNQRVRDIPQSVSVVTRKRLDDQNLTTVMDALEHTTGVNIQDDSNFQRSIYIRGFAVDTVQLDGAPMQIGDGFLTQPDSIIYDRIEVLRGPAGLFNGLGQPSGTVNMVRKRPTDAFEAKGSLQGGSWNNYRAEADVSGPLNESGTVRGRLVGAYQDREFFYDVSKAKNTVLYGVVDFRLQPTTLVTLGASYEKYAGIPAYTGVPMYSDGTDIGLPRSSFLNAAWAKIRSEKTTFFAELEQDLAEDWKFKAAWSYAREKNHEHSGTGWATGGINPATGEGLSLSAFDQHLAGTNITTELNLTGKFDALGRSHDVLLGANWIDKQYDYATQVYEIDNPNVNIFTFDPWDYTTFPTRKGTSRAPADRSTHTQQWGIYGSLRFSLTDSLKLIAGGRYSKWKTFVDDNRTGERTSANSENGTFTPYAALTYDFLPDWTAYASYAAIHRSQSNLFDASGEPLDPVRGSNYELGVKGDMLDGRLQATAALFRIIEDKRGLEDPDYPRPCASSPTGAACYVAGGKVRSQGLELEVVGQLTPDWQLVAGYTYNQTKYLQDTASNTSKAYSTFTPRHMFRLWNTYRFGPQRAWEVGGGVRVQSMTYKTSGDIRLEQSGYAVWDARLAYHISPKMTLALNVNNLFDRHYYRTLGSVAGRNWYGEPRSFMLSLRARM